MRLSDVGKIAVVCWAEIPGHFIHITLDEFIVMPNHIHGIVSADVPNNDDRLRASPDAPAEINRKLRGTSLGTVIGSFKSAVSRRVSILQGNSDNSIWQRSYYEQIIYNPAPLERYRCYIRMNQAQ